MSRKGSIIIIVAAAMAGIVARAEVPDSVAADTLTDIPVVHRIEVQGVPGAILHTNQYLRGDNGEGRRMNHSMEYKLSYAFQHPRGSREALVYKGAYQGVGVAWHEFNPQLSNPFSAYLFQGARIATISRRLTFNYEWNLGLTFGWKPYDFETNPQNRVIGSKVTAYINTDFYLSWRLSEAIDLNTGIAFSHFSNGNTTIPNCGLNVLGGRVGLAYHINREEERSDSEEPLPAFERHVSYDLMFYGGYRRNGYDTPIGPIVFPNKFAVFGFHFNPMYNLNHWFNAGLSVDGVLDRSTNIDEASYIQAYDFDSAENDYARLPPSRKQMALGLSGRAELVMPYFTINFGVGHYLLNAHGDLDCWYQILALKMGITRHTFLHIGYSLVDFKYPNHLMIGIGVRFNHRRRSL